MIFLNKTRIILRIALLLNMGLMANIYFLQAMEESNEESKRDEIDEHVLADRLLKLNLDEKKAYTLFADRYLELIDEIKNFGTMENPQKKEFLKRFLGEAWALRRGQYCTDNINWLDKVKKLGQKSLKDLIERYDDDDDKKTLVKIFDSAKNKLNKNFNSLIVSACHLGYRNLSISEEKYYIEVLQKIINNFPLDDFFINVLFTECLNRCDHSFKQHEKTWKDSLSTFDLEEELRRVCNCELITLKRAPTRSLENQNISVASDEQANSWDSEEYSYSESKAICGYLIFFAGISMLMLSLHTIS